MTANNYVPKRMESKINKEIGRMMENGLNAFYGTFTKFWMKIQVQKQMAHKGEQNDIHALTFEDLQGPLIFCSYLLVFAWFILLLEVIAFKFKMRRN